MSYPFDIAQNPRPRHAAPSGDAFLIDIVGPLGAGVFVATSTDSERHGRDLHAAIVRGDHGPVAAYAAPVATPPAPTAVAIKAECGRRIFAVINETAQKNTAAAAAAGWPGEADEAARAATQAAFVAGVQWIGAMRAVCATLIAAQDATFADSAHWPAPPPSVVALAARF